ncbi:MAG: helix-turn-helix transcriptional regulator [bacterium]|nr:helix-turn-helix transcriptional regulator [bacterium]MDY4101128.1 helix-turn-helix transcriptional regulator [Lachnospiraceae bacterium]
MKYERIRNLREDLDMTQTEIANILNVSQRTYSRYENDERAIPIEIFAELADFHNTSVDYLIGLTDVKKPYPRNKKKSD